MAIQGFGTVGKTRAGARRRRSERDRAVCRQAAASRADGIDIRAASEHKGRSRASPGRPGHGRDHGRRRLPDCDVPAPCAGEHVITENADRVRATIVCEAANAPITLEADRILNDRGVLVLPDVLANAGGVVVPYFEWVQGIQEYFWKEAG